MYLTLLVGYFIALYFYIKKVNSYLYIFFFCLFYSICAFLIDPLDIYAKNNFFVDAVRIYYEIDMSKIYGFDYLFDLYAATPITAVFYYICGVVFQNSQCISVISCFFTYLFYFIGIKRLEKYHGFSEKFTLFLLMLVIFLLSFTLVSWNIRQSLGESILFNILITDFVFNKKKDICLFGYALLSLFHTTFFFVFMLRIVCKYKLKIVLPAIIVVSSMIISSLYELTILEYLPAEVSAILQVKLIGYYNEGALVFSFFARLMGILFVSSFIVFSIFLKCKDDFFSLELKNFTFLLCFTNCALQLFNLYDAFLEISGRFLPVSQMVYIFAMIKYHEIYNGLCIKRCLNDKDVIWKISIGLFFISILYQFLYLHLNQEATMLSGIGAKL